MKRIILVVVLISLMVLVGCSSVEESETCSGKFERNTLEWHECNAECNIASSWCRLYQDKYSNALLREAIDKDLAITIT